MTIRFLCPMGHPLAVPDNRAGKKGRCPVCRQRVVVPRPPGGAPISDDDAADLLAEPSGDEEEDSDVTDSEATDSEAGGWADHIETSPDPLEAPPQPLRRKPAPDARGAAKGPPAASPRPASGRAADPAAAGRRAAKPDDSGLRKSTRNSGALETARYSDPPGDQHRWLEGLVGEWDYRLKLWLDPGETPSRSIGSAEAKWTMSERFLQIEFQGTLLDAGFSSLWTLGYDNAKRAYTSCYLDNRSTGFFLAEGNADADGETLRLFGAMHGWQAGQHNRAYLYVLRQLHSERWTLELHDVLQGEKIMEITC